MTYAAACGLLLAAAGFACWSWTAHSAPMPAPVPHPHAADGTIVFPAGDPQLAYLKSMIVDAGALPVAEPAAGRITYDETRTSRMSSPVLGRVIAQHVEIGDTVRAGDVLAELDSPDLAGAQADARKADADEERKRLALNRARTLFEADVLARKEYENADADYRQADAEARRARQRLVNLHASTAVDGHFGLRAPIAGVVADKQINVGQEVRPDQPNPLLVISDLRYVWAIADVPERVAAGLARGQAVTVETDTGRAVQGTIDRIGVAVDPVTRRVQVRCALANRDGHLKPDMFARITFLAGHGAANALALPNSALFTEGVDTYVYVQNSASTFEKRRVHVALGGALRSFVDAGLRPRERVVTEGALLLNAENENHAG